MIRYWLIHCTQKSEYQEKMFMQMIYYKSLRSRLIQRNHLEKNAVVAILTDYIKLELTIELH
jgi:galactose-1-phosphate uridylyltransferase